ncbi:MAG TPA: GNAT family N-acetyltransferase [Micromonosporaceae bacterium]
MRDVVYELLADRPELIEPAGLLRFREWGRPPEPDDPQWWITVTGDEAGRTGLPVTYVASDVAGELLGTVGIAEFDPDDLTDRSPWVIGMVVRPDRRGEGIGRTLVGMLEPHAAGLGYDGIWVATGPPATAFYERCGYRPMQIVRHAQYGWETHILHRQV